MFTFCKQNAYKQNVYEMVWVRIQYGLSGRSHLFDPWYYAWSSPPHHYSNPGVVLVASLTLLGNHCVQLENQIEKPSRRSGLRPLALMVCLLLKTDWGQAIVQLIECMNPLQIQFLAPHCPQSFTHFNPGGHPHFAVACLSLADTVKSKQHNILRLNVELPHWFAENCW